MPSINMNSVPRQAQQLSFQKNPKKAAQNAEQTPVQNNAVKTAAKVGAGVALVGGLAATGVAIAKHNPQLLGQAQTKLQPVVDFIQPKLTQAKAFVDDGIAQVRPAVDNQVAKAQTFAQETVMPAVNKQVAKVQTFAQETVMPAITERASQAQTFVQGKLAEVGQTVQNLVKKAPQAADEGINLIKNR